MPNCQRLRSIIKNPNVFVVGRPELKGRENGTLKILRENARHSLNIREDIQVDKATRDAASRNLQEETRGEQRRMTSDYETKKTSKKVAEATGTIARGVAGLNGMLIALNMSQLKLPENATYSDISSVVKALKSRQEAVQNTISEGENRDSEQERERKRREQQEIDRRAQKGTQVSKQNDMDERAALINGDTSSFGPVNSANGSLGELVQYYQSIKKALKEAEKLAQKKADIEQQKQRLSDKIGNAGKSKGASIDPDGPGGSMDLVERFNNGGGFGGEF